MALMLSGWGAARFSKTLRIPAGGDNFLKLVRKTPVPAYEEPKVVGIDDFSLKRSRVRPGNAFLNNWVRY
jgi:hypothetical protein